MARSGDRAGLASPAAQRLCRRPSPVTRPGTKAAPRARCSQRTVARPPRLRRAAALPPQSPARLGHGSPVSPRAIPAVGVDALEGGGGGHGALERGRLAREERADRDGFEGSSAAPHRKDGDRCRSLRHRQPPGPLPL